MRCNEEITLAIALMDYLLNLITHKHGLLKENHDRKIIS